MVAGKLASINLEAILSSDRRYKFGSDRLLRSIKESKTSVVKNKKISIRRIS